MARPRRPQSAATSRKQAPPARAGLLSYTRVIGVVLLVASFAGAWWIWKPPVPGPVILISIDTLRADHLAVYGYTKGRTPNIDALAKDSVVFDRAYSHAPQTLPAHTSILTGQLPFEHGVRDNIGFNVKPDAVTLASMFKTAGYGAGGFVSAYVLRAETGIGRGFDVYNADLPMGAMDRPLAQVQRSAAETVTAAVRWLSTHVDPKVFLFVHMYEPHMPYDPPARFKDLAPYDGEIATADESVGALLAELRKRDWYDTATIALIADHGEGLGDHGEEEHGLFLYEPTIHVPFMIKLPAQKSAGRRIATPVQHIDLVPTFAALAGFKSPSALRGRNLLPLMKGGTLPSQGIYSEAMMSRYHFGWSELTSLTDERYKYILAPRPELYDLDRDKQEATNEAAARVQVASAMRSGLEGLVAGRGIDAPGAVTDDDRQRLAALGYIGSSSVAADTPGSSLPDPKDKAELRQAFADAAHAINQLRLTDAASRLEWITSRDPGMVDAWEQYAQVLVRLGRDDDALKVYTRILKTQSSAAPVLLDTATVLLKLKRYDDARTHATAAVTGDPSRAHQMLARIALEQRRFDDALHEAALVEQADSTLPYADFIHGVILHERAKQDPSKFSEALPYLQRAAERIQGRTVQLNDLFYYLGDCLAQTGQLEQAQQAFQHEITLFPNLVKAREGLAMIYEAGGRTGDAARTIATMLAAVPTPATYEAAADLWRILGHPDQAALVAAAGREKFGRQ